MRLTKSRPDPRALYIHVPFCFHKCHYCDFYSIVDAKDRQQHFVTRLIGEIEAGLPYLTGGIETVFIGGGTPTLLRPHLWRALLDRLADWGLLDRSDLEFTVEANPETVTDELMETLVSGGVNRVSLGAQSFSRAHLKTLERWHDPDTVPKAIERIRRAGIERISLDLIFGVPGQTVADWAADLDAALALGPGHMSCYGLTYEPNTAMTKRLKLGEFDPCEEDLEAEMFELTRRRTAEAGLAQYEISNYAVPGQECRHNLLYWRNAEWWACGPSAGGHTAGLRWRNVPKLSAYLDHGPWPPIEDAELVTPERRLGETLMLGLRLRAGIAWSEVETLLAASSDGEAKRGAIERWVESGHLEREDGRLRLSDAGLLIADTVISELI